MKHTLFMIAIEGDELVVTVTCRPEKKEGPFSECVYKIRVPRETGEDLSVEELFAMARQEFDRVKTAL